MYAKLGKVDYSKSLFELFEDKDLVSWNSIISALSQSEKFSEALRLLYGMVSSGVRPDGVTLASILPTCAHLRILKMGKEIHCYALRNEDLSGNSFVGSALVDMYCNCGQVDIGRRVFNQIHDRRIGLWNAMVTGYAQSDRDYEALAIFLEMEAVAGLCSNASTIASILPACARCEDFENKESMHGFVIKRGLGTDKYVQNALIDMYARMGKMEISRVIFDSMEVRDVVSWNTMITGYINCECHENALSLLGKMQKTDTSAGTDAIVDDDENSGDIRPNTITLMTVLPACGALAATRKGQEIHCYAIRHMLDSDIAVGSATVDMYAKCGCLDFARRAFNLMPVRNIVTWNVIIMAYGMNGQGEEALQLFRQMVDEEANGQGLKPNDITFIALLAACSHSGMVDEGISLFNRMKDDYDIDPSPDHYACAVDLLGRAGQVVEAFHLVDTMPSGFSKAAAWSSLLGASRIHQNVEIGEIAAMNLIELEPNVSSHYVLLSNIYSSAGLWDRAMKIRARMMEMGIKKEPGYSWIEFNDKVHRFVAGDLSHPQSVHLYQYLSKLASRMKTQGYVPDTSCVLHDVSEDEKESLLRGHSEKLALAFGILNTTPGTTIRVAKNLRVCNDCHLVAKYISQIEGRDIILRDVRRFHHFREGKCSCGDYW
ncbi:hypothetical protein MLD38_039190 [Melastoma candidum]|nr:hypothetical protein MLD38_039190 [Melastoma candidum]